MASKNIIIKRKIANDIFELMPKTTGEQVSVTYGTEVQSLATALASIYTDIEAWNTFKKDVDFAGQDSALDSLRELIDYLSDQDVATSIAGQLADIKTRLDAAEAAATALAGRVDTTEADISALKTKVGTLEADNATNKEAIATNKAATETNAAAIAKNAEDIAKNAADIAAANEAIAKNTGDIAAANENIGKNADAITALEQSVAANYSKVVYLDADATVPDTVTENDIIMQEI